MKFRNFLISEDKVYLGQRIGDILNGLHDLEENGPSMGRRQYTKNTEGVVNQIRRILHSHWPKEEQKYLQSLQKVGVALMKAIEEKDDLNTTISSASNELEQVMSDLGVPVNAMGSSEVPKKIGDQDGLASSQGEQEAETQEPKEQPSPDVSQVPNQNMQQL